MIFHSLGISVSHVRLDETSKGADEKTRSNLSIGNMEN